MTYWELSEHRPYLSCFISRNVDRSMTRLGVLTAVTLVLPVHALNVLPVQNAVQEECDPTFSVCRKLDIEKLQRRTVRNDAVLLSEVCNQETDEVRELIGSHIVSLYHLLTLF